MKQYIFGEWKTNLSPLTVADVNAICEKARTQESLIANYPIGRVWELLERVSQKWADETYHHRVALLQELPAATGFSKEMIQLAMQELHSLLSPEPLKKKLVTELGGIEREEWRHHAESQTSLQWQPLGTLLHVLSGNVFLVGVGSFLEGVVTGNVTILKASSNEPLFLPRFIESLIECDRDGIVSKSIALIQYSSQDESVISAFKNQVDGIVVWGGEDAVKAYRNNLPARSRVIVYGPKLSAAVVTNEGLRNWDMSVVAEKLAFEMAVWDQAACTAPQVCYVEGRDAAFQFSESLAEALNKVKQTLPAGNAETHQAVEIQKIRSVQEISMARGQGALFASVGSVDWTVFVSDDKTLEPSPLHRTLKIAPYTEIKEVALELLKLKGYVQTIGLASSSNEVMDLSNQLLASGALRVHELGQMSSGEIDDPHDGAYDLSLFGHFVYARVPAAQKSIHPIDLMTPSMRMELIEKRFARLMQTARKAPFYRNRLEGIELQSVKDLDKVRPLTRDELEANMPPFSEGLKAREWSGGYVTRSGGSTGEPKYSVYDKEDWENMISEAERVLRTAGIGTGDRVANCMLAGDLYGSFVSFDHIHHRIGATTFAFAGQVNPEVFLDVWKKWKINVLVAMPTVIMPLVKVCKQLHKDFSLQKIVYAGTPLSQSDRDWLTQNIGVKSVASVIGANDGGQLAYQCGHLTGAYHHLVDEFNYVEILDENNRSVPMGQPGKIVITSLLKTAYPLIRYEIGDSGRFVNKACTCGRTSRIIEYLGRSDDTICVGMMNLRYRDIVSALKEHPTSVIQLVAENNLEGEWITLRIECESQTEENRMLIHNALLSALPVIEEKLASGHLIKVNVHLFKAGELPRSSRTGKVKLVLDERI